jgi:hypothetical protein
MLVSWVKWSLKHKWMLNYCVYVVLLVYYNCPLTLLESILPVEITILLMMTVAVDFAVVAVIVVSAVAKSRLA